MMLYIVKIKVDYFHENGVEHHTDEVVVRTIDSAMQIIADSKEKAKKFDDWMRGASIYTTTWKNDVLVKDECVYEEGK